MGHLVIGVGGTGFKTLCMLKALLQNSNRDGTMPSGVVLRAIDTEHPEEALQNKQNEILGYGGTPLDGTSEYIWLGANEQPIGPDLTQVGQALMNNALPTGVPGQWRPAPAGVGHFTSWLQAGTLVNLLQPAQWNVTIGAGQHRQIARLALFWNVQNPATSQFHQRMINGITAASTPEGLNVYLIGSTVGGTGAGLFVDVAYLVRQLRQQGTACNVTAFLLLPESYSAIPELANQGLPGAKSRTYAALREIERFTTGLKGHPRGFRIAYDPLSQDARYRGERGTLEKLLDAVYYVDGSNTVQRNGSNPRLNSFLPEDGCIPLVADTVFALLQDSGPQRRTHMTNVATIVQGPQFGAAGLSAAAADIDLVSFSSGCGTYSIVLPMAQIVESLAWRLVGETAAMLAKPGAQAGTLDANRPNGNAGRSELATFCSGQIITGQHKNPGSEQPSRNYSSGSTDLLQDIANEGSRYGDGTNPNDVQASARIFKDRNLANWQQKLTLRHTDIGADLEAAWNAELGKNFVVDDPRRRVMVPVSPPGQNCQNAWSTVKRRVEEEFLNILGTRNNQTGTYTGGTLQGIVGETRQHLLVVLRRRLWLQSMNILNGSQPSTNTGTLDMQQVQQVIQERGNSIGYLDDFLRSFEGLLRSYRSAIVAGQTARNRPAEKGAIVPGEFDATEQEGDNNPCPGIMSRGAEGLRKRYLEKAQDLLDLRRIEQIEAMVLDIVRIFADDLKTLREVILQWGRNVSIGGEASVRAVAQLNQQRTEDAGAQDDIPIREKIWDATYNEQLYNNYSSGGAPGVITQLNWWLLQPGEQGRTLFDVQLFHGTSRYSEPVGLASGLHKSARGAFDLAWQQESILNYLQMRGTDPRWNPPAVSQRLQTNSNVQLAAQGGVPSVYVVVPLPTDPLSSAYRTSLLAAIQGNPPDNLKRDLAGSDRFRLTYVAWKDAVGLKNVASFTDAANQYDNFLSRLQYPDPAAPPRFTRETLHAMPGEVQVAGVEARLQSVPVQPPLVTPGEPRRLDYQVIQQLEDVPHLRKFLNAWTWGVIAELPRRFQEHPVRVYGFELEAERDFFGDVQPTTEYWLTAPTEMGAEPSMLEALWTWNYDWNDKYRLLDGSTDRDEKGRTRPSPDMSKATFEKVQQATHKARESQLLGWQETHTEWVNDLPPAERALHENAPDDVKLSLAKTRAEVARLQQRLVDLRVLEGRAASRQAKIEQDAIAMLLVLLWEDLENSKKSFRAIMQQVRT